MVFIPRAGFTPLADDPLVQPFPGLDEMQENTHNFIMISPTPIVLIPIQKTVAAGGGWNAEELPPRPSQNFRLISLGLTLDGLTLTNDGQTRRWDFVLLGEWNATVQIGDFFQDSVNDNQFWTVFGLLPFNGYEVKAAITSYGRRAKGG